MPEEFNWGPGGWPKTPRGGGVFATTTPQVFIGHTSMNAQQNLNAH